MQLLLLPLTQADQLILFFARLFTATLLQITRESKRRGAAASTHSTSQDPAAQDDLRPHARQVGS